ncbi:STAS domain-containing protein [Acuticoccus mangrovi]|uniref:Anti-sigma factor antagonist n=1 Tax=Acuticoccus mangrovi TaxID=2796142 RepID=A0A934IQB9_9HYPH|nr:STAS domain-containing protein [Acuticoccus mangrovi]
MSELAIQHEEVGPVLVLVLSGRIDSATAKTLETEILGRLGQGVARIVIDLAKVEYISSAGLRVILLGGKKAKAGGGAIVLCTLQPAIRDVFEISGFLRLFEVTPTRTEAVSVARAA